MLREAIRKIRNPDEPDDAAGSGWTGFETGDD
jgi:hypothetical protein